MRIVPNIFAGDPAEADRFYGDVLGLELPMDMGFIRTFRSERETAQPQISVMTEGGSGTPVPAISIEVDDLGEVLERVRANGIQIEYGPVKEPWGVRRFYVRDPFGTLVNILQH
nr:VOC family protein [Notoacmeibacter sp. MSK16QG-6]